MTDRGFAALLDAYDEQLRTAAEVQGALSVTRLGPLWLAIWDGESGFVTYRDLAGVDGPDLDALIRRARDRLIASGATEIEWKTRGHDVAPGLDGALTEAGFAPRETETIMIGEAARLAEGPSLPDGVALRRVDDEAGLWAMARMQDAVFGRGTASRLVGQLLADVTSGHGVQAWVAEAGGEVVCAGCLEPEDGTDFALLRGGATLPGWRHRGIYRALTAARAAAALRAGKRYLHSDSTPMSRPVLERAGLVPVSTTTPFVWSR